jgi:hypothetical protein
MLFQIRQPTAAKRLTARIPRPALALLLALILLPAAASATQAPVSPWRLTTIPVPTLVPPSATGTRDWYYVSLENVSANRIEGELTLRDLLPEGVIAQQALGDAGIRCDARGGGETNEYTPELERSREIVCHLPVAVVPGGFVATKFLATAAVTPGSPLTNIVSVSGGGAAPVLSETTTHAARVDGENGPAGINDFKLEPTGPAGEPVDQAGGHPTFVTTTAFFNNMLVEDGRSNSTIVRPVEPVKDLVFYLPVGMLGDPLVVQKCPIGSILRDRELGECPPASRVGTILDMATGNIETDTADPTTARPLYNIFPGKGYAAEFAFEQSGLTIVSYASVVFRDGQYMLRVASPGVPTSAWLGGLIATFHGDIQEPFEIVGHHFTRDLGAFITNPSVCGTGPLDAGVEMNTTVHPETPLTATATAYQAIEGCEALKFSSTLSSGPEVRTQGDTTEADEPSGYRMSLEVPVAPNNAQTLDTPPIKDVSLTMPAGTALSPGAANGLSACAASGPRGIDFPTGEGTPGNPGTATSEGEEDAVDGLPRPVPGHCPASSIVATVTAKTPLLAEELEGHLYLAEPECGNVAHPSECTPQDAADGSIYRLYLELEAEQAGVNIKLRGSAHVNPGTGQITTVFEDAPQFPLSDLVVETTGGPRAALANPQTCGTATTTGLITPWSGGAPTEPAGAFEVNEGCGSQGFSPSFTAGTSNTAAGAYAPFTLTLKREDREQDVNALSTMLPKGLVAAISHVTQCPEPQAAQGACPASSRIGTTTVGIGSGSGPYYQSGPVYLTGPYHGAPFGLAIVVPAVAGPFNLGNVIVRAAVYVNPLTAQVTTVSDPIPQMIDGVPLRTRTINVTLDAPNFMQNPTNCAPMSITGTANSTLGTQTNVSAPFQATGCRTLAFKPSLAATTQAKTSKADGASLTFKLVPPAEGPANATAGSAGAAASEEANIKTTKVELPKQLPSRLSTLQQACSAAQFDSNPAGCPPASMVGLAVAHTPVLNSPLTGPAYFVSHGNEAFPQLIVVLQGEGITIDLVGDTFISKAGITSSTFKEDPDEPISSFELTLPEGPYSALTTLHPGQTNLCAEKLSAPTEFTAENGAVVKENTSIAVAGCANAISVSSHSLANGTLTVRVSVPSAGKLTLAGEGLSSGTAASGGRETVAVKLRVKLTDSQRAVIQRHPGRMVLTRVGLRFTPRSGRKLSKTFSVKL